MECVPGLAVVAKEEASEEASEVKEVVSNQEAEVAMMVASVVKEVDLAVKEAASVVTEAVSEVETWVVAVESADFSNNTDHVNLAILANLPMKDNKNKSFKKMLGECNL